MTALHQSRAQADGAADKLRTFAHPLRLMILSLLLERGEQSVSEIDEATGIGQPALSQQLAELRRADMVSSRRQAKQVYYSLADAGTELCVRSIEAVFGAGQAPGSLPLRAGLPPAAGVASGAAGFVRLLPG